MRSKRHCRQTDKTSVARIPMKSTCQPFRFARSILVAGLASLWAACPSHAASPTIGPATEATTTTSADDDGPPPSQLTIKPYGIYQFPADWKNGSSVSSSHSGVSAEYSLPVLPYTLLDLSVTGEYSHYSLTNTLDVPARSVDGSSTCLCCCRGRWATAGNNAAGIIARIAN